jgi:hypothetical protein
VACSIFTNSAPTSDNLGLDVANLIILSSKNDNNKSLKITEILCSYKNLNRYPQDHKCSVQNTKP